MASKTPPYVIKLIEKAAEEKAEFIDLGKCGLRSMPEEIVLCAEYLKEINFGFYYYKKGKIIESKNDLQKNIFSENPDSLDVLKKITELTTLHLRGCDIGENGAEIISRLASLSSLDISDNNIGEEGAESISRLASLSSLNISDNKIGEKGAESISKLASLSSLDISDNGISDKGAESISRLASLSSLAINFSRIGDKGAESISRLSSLSSLAISFNRIGEKGVESISRLSSLSSLDISLNEIGEKGAESISKLASLTSLVISGNGISDKGAESISRLPSLASLVIRYNGIGDKGAESISRLPSLSSLDISYNGVGDKGSEAISHLNLSKLNIANNKITYLIPFLKWLEKGFDLEISDDYSFDDNQINITNNPITTPPEEVWKQGKDEVLRWFEDKRISGGTKPINECKVIFVGQGEVGKTSLMKRLVYGTFDIYEKTTHGINKISWKDKVFSEKGESIKVNMWDFGGQHIQNSLHQFFFTNRVIYVLVLRPRNDEYMKYWLDQITRLGKDSDIIVVYNWRDKKDIESGYHQMYNSMKKHFPKMSEPIELSCKEDIGIEKFRKVLTETIVRQPDINAQFPNNWFKIKEKLEEEITPLQYVLSYNDYVKWCNEFEYRDTDKQRELLIKLDFIGSIVFFNKKILNQLQVLNPDWITIGAYTVLLSPVTSKMNGHLTHHDLCEIFKDEITVPFIKDIKVKYEERDFMYILELMKEYELCQINPLEHGEYLIPSALGPRVKDYSAFKNNAVVYQYKFSGQFEMPIMHRLMVRNIHRIKDVDYWDSGILIYQDNTSALIETDIYSETITCWIKGNNIRGFWENIRQDVKDIIRVLNITGKESVEYDHEGQKVFIPYEEMLNTLKAGIRILPFHPVLGLSDIDVLKVLDMFEDRSTTNQVLEELKKTVRETLKGNINIEVNQHQNIDQKLNVNTTINLSDSKELHELKSLIEDLKQDSQKNKEWQEDLVKVLSEISAIENASTKEQQKKKWLDVKKIWETMKIFKDAKALSDTIPWLHDKVEHITTLIGKIGEMF